MKDASFDHGQKHDPQELSTKESLMINKSHFTLVMVTVLIQLCMVMIQENNILRCNLVILVQKNVMVIVVSMWKYMVQVKQTKNYLIVLKNNRYCNYVSRWKRQRKSDMSQQLCNAPSKERPTLPPSSLHQRYYNYNNFPKNKRSINNNLRFRGNTGHLSGHRGYFTAVDKNDVEMESNSKRKAHTMNSYSNSNHIQQRSQYSQAIFNQIAKCQNNKNSVDRVRKQCVVSK